MAGVLFVINVPRKKHEEELIKKGITSKIVKETDGDEKPAVEEVPENINGNSLRYSVKDYLDANDKESCLKSKSENVLNANDMGSSEKKIHLKSTLENTQTQKPNRNKIQITRPATGVDVLADFHWDTPLETILSEIIFRLNIKNATWSYNDNNQFCQVMFSLESGHVCEELLQVLRTFGIGSRYQSLLSVIPCALYYKSGEEEFTSFAEDQSDTSAWSRFSSSVRARTNLAQVLHDVRSEAALTFDWLFLLIVAAFVAAIGLIENSTVILVASMLISPLMGPITAGTLGTAVSDRSLQLMGLSHELLGLFLSLVIGFIFGLGICAVDERYGVGEWPTIEMLSRCETRSLWVGVLVAIPSGAGVALAVLGENTASLVGVAISASLLPPAVNAGLLWAMSLVHLIYAAHSTRSHVVTSAVYSTSQAAELAMLGVVSLCLTLLNILCIFLTGVAVYKIKEVRPLEHRDISWWRRNRSIMRLSKRGSKSQKDDPPTLDFYNNWSYTTKQTEQEPGNSPGLGLIQSDTVTYRRHQAFMRTLRPENFDSYCNRKTSIMESFMNVEVEQGPLNHVTSQDQDKGNDSLEDSLEKESDINEKNELKSIYNFSNKAFEGEDNCYNKNKPILKPSLNFTVGQKFGVVLSSETFDV